MKTPDFKYMLEEGWDKGDYTSPPAEQSMLDNLDALCASIPDDFTPIKSEPISCCTEAWVTLYWLDEEEDTVNITVTPHDSYFFNVCVRGLELSGACNDVEAVLGIVRTYMRTGG